MTTLDRPDTPLIMGYYCVQLQLYMATPDFPTRSKLPPFNLNLPLLRIDSGRAVNTPWQSSLLQAVT